MKAIRVHEFGDPEVMRIEDVPDLQPGPGQVVIRVKAVGVNPVETYIRAGHYAFKPPLPYTPGNDAAGVVEAVGPEVTHVHVGDRVYLAGSVSGTYAEQALSKAEQVHPLPEGLSFAQGAALGVAYGTAYYGLFIRGEALPGETVLVHGASGGVGTAAVQMAKAAGMTVFATAGTDRGRQMVKDQGADHVLDHHAEGYLDQIKSLTGGPGVNIVLEMLANVNLPKDLTVLAPHGRVVVIGSRGPVEIDPRQTMGTNLSILGMTLARATAAEMQRIHAALGAGLRNGTLHPVIGQEIPLAEAPRAHEAVMEAGAHGKIVLVP